MSDTLSVADVLGRAADLIEPEGAWMQGAYKEGCSFCAIGAIAEVWGISAPHAHDWAQKHQWPGVGSLRAWNDAPERTQAEVVAKLREAAAAARAQDGSAGL